MSDQDLIHQADALMQRHRATPGLASAAETSPEDDVPVLTEVVDLPEGNAPQDIPNHAAVPADPMIAARAALASELETWLDECLPEVVLRILDGLSDQLIIQVAAQARLELLPRLKAALQETKAKPE